MKHIPNILSASRIAWCLPLLLVDAMTVSFWVFYVIAGTADMLDGFLARRWGAESKFGARLDSLADFVFVLAAGYKLFPWLKLPATLWMMTGVIALVKAGNAVSAYVTTPLLCECSRQSVIYSLHSLWKDKRFTVTLCHSILGGWTDCEMRIEVDR